MRQRTLGKGLLKFFCCLTLLLCLCNIAGAKPKVVFWWDSHPGMPPRSEWKKDDKPPLLAKEMYYNNMKARPGSPKHYQALKALGFDAVGLGGFEGPFRYFDPNSDGLANLDHVMQTRNQRYYIRWAREAGLEVYLNVQFFRGEVASVFSWRDDYWEKVIRYVRSISRFAKRTGCDGLIFDFEPYDIQVSNPYFHWSLPYWCDKLGLDREKFLQLMSQRGAEFAKAVSSEFPECILHVYGIGTGAGTAQDYQEVLAHFFSGLCESKLAQGIHLNVPNTYYIYDPRWVADMYHLDVMPNFEKAVQISKDPGYLREKCSIALGSAALHRWHRGDGMYDRAVYRLTQDRYAAHLLSLLHNCPRYVWMVGESSFDWTMPDLSKEVLDDPYNYWGLDVPFADMSVRNRKLTETFAQVVRLTDEQISSAYQKALKENEQRLAQLRQQVPRAAVAYLHNNEAYLEFDNDLDWRIRHLWSLNSYPKLDLGRLTEDLPKTDIVITCVSAIWADRTDEENIARPRELPMPERWREFVRRGGVLIVADLEANPNASRWLGSIDADLSLPARLEPCEPNKPAGWWNEKEPVLREPNRLRLFTCGRHLSYQEAGSKGWIVLAKCPHGKPIYLMHRYGKGLVAVLLSSKFQVGFGWEHVMNLLKAAR